MILWPFESLPAQNLQLSVNAGYYTGAGLKATRGRFIFGDGRCYTGSIAYTVQPDKTLQDVCFELQYGYVSSTLRFQRYNSETKMPLGTIKMHTILAGAGKEFGKGPVHFYGKAFMGAAYFVPDSLNNVDRVTFSFSFASGIRIAITHSMGVCLQAQFLLPLMYNRVYVGWEPDNGLQTIVTPLGILYSGYLTGGIYYKIIQRY